MSDKEPECLEGWIPIHRGCFKFVESKVKWEEARDSCRSEKGDLTYIQSLKEKDLLERHLRSHYPTFSMWWMGLHRQENRGTDWKWLDEGVVDTAVMPWRFPFIAGRPGNVCGVLEMFGGSMYAANEMCSRKKPYICEFNSIMPRPTTKATTNDPTSTTITTPEPGKQGGSLNTTEDIYSKVTTSDQTSQDTEPSTAPTEEVETDTSSEQPDEVWTSTTEHIATTSQGVFVNPQENGQEAERNGQGSGSPKTTIIDFYIVFLSLCYFFVATEKFC